MRRIYAVNIVEVVALIGLGVLLAISLFSLKAHKPNPNGSYGNILVHTTSGDVIGYYGRVIVNNDGTSAPVNIDLTDAWMVGETSETK